MEHHAKKITNKVKLIYKHLIGGYYISQANYDFWRIKKHRSKKHELKR